MIRVFIRKRGYRFDTRTYTHTGWWYTPPAPHPAPSCRIVARGNRISREAASQAEAKNRSLYVQREVRVAAATTVVQVRDGDEEKETGVKKKERKKP